MSKSAFTKAQHNWVTRVAKLIENIFEGYGINVRIISVELTTTGYIFEIENCTKYQLLKILPDFLNITKYQKNDICINKSANKPKTTLFAIPLETTQQEVNKLKGKII